MEIHDQENKDKANMTAVGVNRVAKIKHCTLIMSKFALLGWKL